MMKQLFRRLHRKARADQIYLSSPTRLVYVFQDTQACYRYPATPRHSRIAALSSKEFTVPPGLTSITDIYWDPALLTLNGHTEWVSSVAISPDGNGKKIVSGSHDQTLRVWDAETGSNILGPLLGHTDSVTSVAFYPDGKKIVSSSVDQILRVWDAETGSNILGPLLGHTDSVTSITFSPNGKKILSGSDDKTLIGLTFYKVEMMQIAFSPSYHLGHIHNLWQTLCRISIPPKPLFSPDCALLIRRFSDKMNVCIESMQFER